MSDALTRHREAAAKRQAAKPVDTGRVLDKTDRTEATYSPDARKARALVKMLASGSLPYLCCELAKIVGDLTLKHRLQEVHDAFRTANDVYRREELLTPGLCEWVGGAGPGRLPELSAGAPEHKVAFANAWNAMLQAVNEATKVGVHRPHREHPIMLMIDLDTTFEQATRVAVSGVNWDD